MLVLFDLQPDASFVETVSYMTGIKRIPTRHEPGVVGNITLFIHGILYEPKRRGKWPIDNGCVGFVFNKQCPLLNNSMEKVLTKLCTITNQQLVYRINKFCEIFFNNALSPPMIVWRRVSHN